MRILAIETSFDDTVAAIVEDNNFKPVVISNAAASQISAHAHTGGAIPNIAARLHVKALPLVLDEVTHQQTLSYDAVAVTIGPGLIGSLLMGVSAAKSIALAKNIPFYGVNHMEGHIYSSWLSNTVPELPALIVVVSGGHSDLIYMKRHLDYQYLGQTRDDAAGEAFDKVARLLELPYPGGPEIAKLAQHGERSKYKFPISLREKGNLEFSFSGLKASVAHLVSELPAPLPQHIKADIAASFEHTVAETIALKTVRALEDLDEVKTVCLVGGVSANKYLRSYLETEVKKARPEVGFIVPPFEYCTDNAAMIASAAIFRYLFGQNSSDDWRTVETNPNLSL